MTFFDNIKQLCDERSISIAQFENDIGLPGRNSYKWKDHNPNVAIAAKIAKYFEVPVETLMNGVPEWKGRSADE